MKLIKTAILAAGILAASASTVRAEGEKDNVFGINPLGLPFGIYTGDYARFIQGGKAEIDVPFTFWSFDDIKYFNLGGKYRLHLKGTNEGPFAGGGVYVGYLTWDFKSVTIDNSWNLVEKTETVTGVVVEPVVELGYRWIWGSGFTLAPSAELGYGIGKIESSSGATPSASADGMQWGLNLGLGWNF